MSRTKTDSDEKRRRRVARERIQRVADRLEQAAASHKADAPFPWTTLFWMPSECRELSNSLLRLVEGESWIDAFSPTEVTKEATLPLRAVAFFTRVAKHPLETMEQAAKACGESSHFPGRVKQYRERALELAFYFGEITAEQKDAYLARVKLRTAQRAKPRGANRSK